MDVALLSSENAVEFEVRMNGYVSSSALRYVYIDRSFSGIPFYVGIGGLGRLHAKRRSIYHTNVSRKFASWYREVVECSDFESCKEFESFLISELGRRDNKTGVLVNHTDGGDGVLGRVVSERELLNNPAKKDKNREASRKRMILSNPMKKPDIAKKVSDKLKGRALPEATRKKLLTANTGRLVSEETKIKISLTQLGVPKLSSRGERNCMKRQEARIKNSIAQKGRIFSEKHKIALRKSHIGKKWIVRLLDGKATQKPESAAGEMVSSGLYKYGRKK